ncbi:NAD-dependent epimerase/dehydratase family protein [Williamsia sp. MIQD14]|uniref:NAD-dependent epimerase/dehydratase family protein n=1 Tax=Williamsia sp. MIQD14 TaxID=3425703 RepID=UPI003D9FB772
MTTVAVTGATSDFGTAILPLLLADPTIDRVIGLGRREPRVHHAKLENVRADIRSPELERVFTGCDVVIHLAFVVEEQRDKAASSDVNLGGSRNTVECAHRAGVRHMVIASSASAYGAVDLPVPVTEDEFPTSDPNRYYFFDKAEVEHFVEWWLRRHPGEMTIALLRPTFVVGADIANDAIDMLTGMAIAFPDPATSHYQFMTQHDMARAFHLAAATNLNGPFNIAPRDHTSAPTLARIQGQAVTAASLGLLRLLADIGYRLRVVPFSSHWISSGEAALDPDLFCRSTGWEPSASSDDVAAAMVLLRGRPLFGGAEVLPSARVAEVALEPATRRLRRWAETDSAIGELIGDVDTALSRLRHITLDTPAGGVHAEVHPGDGGPTIVLGVAGRSHARYVTPLAVRLASEGCTVVVVDTPGHGLSSGRRGTRRGHDRAVDAVAAVQADPATVIVKLTGSRRGGPCAPDGPDGLIDFRAGARLPWKGRSRRAKPAAAVANPRVTAGAVDDLRTGAGQQRIAETIHGAVRRVGVPASRG